MTRFDANDPVFAALKLWRDTSQDGISQGAGRVRELRQAATLSGSVQGLLTQFAAADTRAGQKAILDQLLTAWADTSGMGKTLEERAVYCWEEFSNVANDQEWRSAA